MRGCWEVGDMTSFRHEVTNPADFRQSQGPAYICYSSEICEDIWTFEPSVWEDVPSELEGVVVSGCNYCLEGVVWMRRALTLLGHHPVRSGGLGCGSRLGRP